METKKLLNIIKEVLEDRKAEDIVELDISKKSSVAEYYLVSSANSQRQVTSILEYLDEFLVKNHNIEPIRRESIRQTKWGVLDYGDIIVHVFLTSEREKYNIENLWDKFDDNKELLAMDDSIED